MIIFSTKVSREDTKTQELHNNIKRVKAFESHCRINLLILERTFINVKQTQCQNAILLD